jgi:hypothetical protein
LAVTWCVAFVNHHCLAFRFEPSAGCWIISERMRTTTLLRAVPPKVLDRWIVRLVKQGAVILAVEQGPGQRLATGCPCVAEVKRLTGFRSGALFPHALRRDLERSGARRVYAP